MSNFINHSQICSSNIAIAKFVVASFLYCAFYIFRCLKDQERVIPVESNLKVEIFGWFHPPPTPEILCSPLSILILLLSNNLFEFVCFLLEREALSLSLSLSLSPSLYLSLALNLPPALSLSLCLLYSFSLSLSFPTSLSLSLFPPLSLFLSLSLSLCPLYSFNKK